MDISAKIDFKHFKKRKKYLSTVATALYLILIFALYPQIEIRAGIFSALPVMVIPFLYGLRVGILSYVLITFLLTPLALSIAAAQNIYVPYLEYTGFGMFMGLMATMIIGYIHDLHGHIDSLNAKLVDLSRVDPLTKLYNRRAFFDVLEGEYVRALRKFWHHKDLSEDEKNNGVFSCVLLDLDYFKEINDTYGHLVGDTVLKTVAELLSSHNCGLRESDTIGRFGGEEFIILLPDTDPEQALLPLERIRKELKLIPFKSNNGDTFHISFSGGIAHIRKGDKSFMDVVNRADQALYFAKQNGRDQIFIYENITEEEIPAGVDVQVA